MNFGKIDRCMIFGGGQLFTDAGLRLKSAGYEVQAVTSQRHLQETLLDDPTVTLEAFLNDHEIDYVVSNNVNTDAQVTEEITETTLGCSFGAAWVFRSKFIDRFGGRLINFHGSRLPQDRGGGGYSWRILRDDRLGFSLIHQVNPGIDSGQIIAYREYFFPHSCRTPVDYHRYAVGESLEFFDAFLADLRAGADFQGLAQPEYLSTYWPRLSTDIHGYIDWSWKLRDIEQFICAFDDPYPGAMTLLNDTNMRIKRCLSTTSDGTFHPFQQGIIYRITGGAAFVAVGEGSLIISSVTDDSGADRMSHLNVGDRFHTPSELLDEAMRRRVVYTPRGLREEA